MVGDSVETLCFLVDTFELNCFRAVGTDEAFAGSQVNCISVRGADEGLVEAVLSVATEVVQAKALESLLLDDVDRFGFHCCQSAGSGSVVLPGGGD